MYPEVVGGCNVPETFLYTDDDDAERNLRAGEAKCPLTKELAIASRRSARARGPRNSPHPMPMPVSFPKLNSIPAVPKN